MNAQIDSKTTVNPAKDLGVSGKTLSAGDEFCSEGYAMYADYVSDERGDPTVELWRFCTEDDYVEGYGWLHIRVHEIIQTERSGALAVYHRQWFAPDGEPAWGNRKKRVIGSVASLKALIRRRNMTAQAIEARRAATGTGAVHESAVLKGCAQ